MDLTLSQCFVIVHDPDRALGFYRDTLGLDVRNDVANEGFRWITVGAASQPGVAIVLTNYLNGSPADGEAVAALVAKGALNGVHFRTDDLDATFEKVRDVGRRDRAGADRAVLGHEGLRRARPFGQHGAHRPAAGVALRREMDPRRCAADTAQCFGQAVRRVAPGSWQRSLRAGPLPRRILIVVTLEM